MEWKDGKIRCRWANPGNERYIHYHDHEWGVPVHDDRKLFEMLVLEGFQAGLSWECVLNKREAFSRAFDGFDLSHFSGDGRIIMENNLAICRSYAEEFTTDADTVCGDKKNLLLYGLTGLGKTHLSAAIAARLIRRGYDVVYETAINLFGTFERERFMRDDRNGRRESERYFDCDVLIIDDLGTELSNQFTATVLFNVINTRLCRGSATIINTNLSQKEIRERYDGRTSSRIFGEFRPLPFVGTDYRLLKLER